MFKKFMGKSQTTKYDVLFAVGAAIIAAWKAVDTVKDYQLEQAEKELES